MGSPVLRCAADGYDRAARAAYGRVPDRTDCGDRLRAAARMLAMTGGTAGDSTAQARGLVTNLVTLVDAVAGLREAQAHAAQAAAAREAAERLNAAFAQARGRTPHPGQAHARSAQAGVPPDRAQADFPVPLAEVLSVAAAQESGDVTSPSYVPRPPSRARPAR